MKIKIKKIKILLIYMVFIYLKIACASESCDMACMSSPSGTCVVDDSTSSIIQQCAVGCYEAPGPFGNAYCTYGPFTCTFYGLYDYSCCNGDTPEVRCSVAKWAGHMDLSDCVLECAAACGRRTKLSDHCEECTISEICSCPKYPAGSNMLEVCNRSCSGVCESNMKFCDIITLLRYSAMFVGAILLILHGFKWMVSEDAEGVTDAKRGIKYIMAGFFVIVLASALVELIFFHTIVCSPYWWF